MTFGGSDHVMLGSDFPYQWGTNYDKVVGLVERSKYGEKEREAILGENAANLFRID